MACLCVTLSLLESFGALNRILGTTGTGDEHLSAGGEGASVRAHVWPDPPGSQAGQLLLHGGWHRQDRGECGLEPKRSKSHQEVNDIS